MISEVDEQPVATVPVAVVVAPLGRPQNLAALLDRLAQQAVLPARVILSMESEADAPEEKDYPFPVARIFGPQGSCVQRKSGLDLMTEEPGVFNLYDDDFVPSRFAPEAMIAFFAAHPEVAGAEGFVLKDGIKGPGLSPAEARQIMDDADAAGASFTTNIQGERRRLYGSNMAFPLTAVRDVRFDETLPLYVWFEDPDLGVRVAGRLVHTDAVRGVHCGEKRGRKKNGRKLGCSRIANPVCLMRKGRVIGNRIGGFDLLRGKSDPRRIRDL